MAFQFWHVSLSLTVEQLNFARKKKSQRRLRTTSKGLSRHISSRKTSFFVADSHGLRNCILSHLQHEKRGQPRYLGCLDNLFLHFSARCHSPRCWPRRSRTMKHFSVPKKSPREMLLSTWTSSVKFSPSTVPPRLRHNLRKRLSGLEKSGKMSARFDIKQAADSRLFCTSSTWKDASTASYQGFHFQPSSAMCRWSRNECGSREEKGKQVNITKNFFLSFFSLVGVADVEFSSKACCRGCYRTWVRNATLRRMGDDNEKQASQMLIAVMRMKSASCVSSRRHWNPRSHSIFPFYPRAHPSVSLCCGKHRPSMNPMKHRIDTRISCACVHSSTSKANIDVGQSRSLTTSLFRCVASFFHSTARTKRGKRRGTETSNFLDTLVFDALCSRLVARNARLCFFYNSGGQDKKKRFRCIIRKSFLDSRGEREVFLFCEHAERRKAQRKVLHRPEVIIVASKFFFCFDLWRARREKNNFRVIVDKQNTGQHFW